MNKISLIVLGLSLYSFSSADEIKAMGINKMENSVQPSVTYTCPMHPEIHAAKPGNCPKCGMKLVKEKQKVVVKPKEVVKPKIEKPVMQMPDDKKDTLPVIKQQQAVSYTCPMHPEIHSDKPGNCPKCGMKLVQEKPKNKHHQEMKITRGCR